MSKNFTWPITTYLYEDYIKLKECLEKNKDKLKDKELIIFGAGIRGSLFGKLLPDFGYHSFIYVDNNKDKWGGYIEKEEHIIKNPDYLSKNITAKIIIISIEQDFLIIEQLLKLGYKKDINIFSPKTNVYDDYINEFFRQSDTEVLVLGDCFFISNFYF